MQNAHYSGPKLLFRLVVTTGDIVAAGHDFIGYSPRIAKDSGNLTYNPDRNILTDPKKVRVEVKYDMSQHLTPILSCPDGSEEILTLRAAKRFIREVRNRIPVEWLCTPDEYEIPFVTTT